MLTLKELKKIVKVADVEKRIPSVKSLKEHKVVVKEMINADTTISVYDHGYVLYTAGNQSTVFPLHSCDDYEYAVSYTHLDVYKRQVIRRYEATGRIGAGAFK